MMTMRRGWSAAGAVLAAALPAAAAACDQAASDAKLEAAYRASDDLAALHELSSEAVALCDSSAPAHNALATALEKQGYYDDATRHYQRAQQLRPSWALPFLGEGDVLLQRGERAGARVAYLKAISLATSERERRDAEEALESAAAADDGFSFKSEYTITRALNIGEQNWRPRAPMAFVDAGEEDDIVVTPEERRVNLTVEFVVDSAKLTDAAKLQLDELGKALSRAARGETYTLRGHASTEGEEGYNQALSERRAKAVQSYLVGKFDLAGAKLRAVGLGERQPVRRSDGSEDRKKSRRVAVARPYDP